MPRVRRLAADELKRALGVHFVHFGGSAEVEEMASQSWASVTFSGERHRLGLRLHGEGAGAAADSFAAGLSERQFALRGHILADIALVSDDRGEDGSWARLTLEALTVESS